MAINVTLGKAKTQKEKPFPKLMKHKNDGTILYFYRKGVGIPINNEDYCFSDTEGWASAWIMDAFEDYNQPITIQNA